MAWKKHAGVMQTEKNEAVSIARPAPESAARAVRGRWQPPRWCGPSVRRHSSRLRRPVRTHPLGWSRRPLWPAFSQDLVAKVATFASGVCGRQQGEAPLWLCRVAPRATEDEPKTLPATRLIMQLGALCCCRWEWNRRVGRLLVPTGLGSGNSAVHGQLIYMSQTGHPDTHEGIERQQRPRTAGRAVARGHLPDNAAESSRIMPGS